MRRSFIWTVYLVMAVLLAACAAGPSSRTSPGTSDNSHLPLGKPYTVRGKTYVPYTSAHGFREAGVASWYGPGFHGKLTANGEKYDQYAMTAAHKLLPFNTQIRVTNLDTGKSTVVRINDRGPFLHDRVIDLSHKAAQQIGMLQSGTARVHLEAINTTAPAGSSPPRMTAQSQSRSRSYVQIGSFTDVRNARECMQSARKMGMRGRVVRDRGTGLHYVQVGPFPSAQKADETMSLLQPQYPGLFVLTE